MTKRLIGAAQAALGSIVYTHRRAELQVALDEARQPVTVTPDQAVELILTFCREADGEPTPAEVEGLTAKNKQKIVTVITAILQKSRELGL